MSELDTLVQKLTTGGDSKPEIFDRAITLFEFQIELVYPGRRLGVTRDCAQNEARCTEAALFATTKLLERAQSDLATRLNRELTLADLTADPLFSTLFDKEFLPQGGFLALRQSRSVRSFSNYVEMRWKEAEIVADLIDASYRFRKEDVSTRHKGGIVFAREYLADAPEYASKKLSDYELKRLWYDYEPGSGFIYLIFRQGYTFKPPRADSKKFVERILEQASDTKMLAEFFAAYRALRSALQPLGAAYSKLPKIRFDLQQEPPTLPKDPLPRASLEAAGFTT